MQQTTLPAEYQLPHPATLSKSPTEQLATLESLAVDILRDLTNILDERKDRLIDAQITFERTSQADVDNQIALGQVPAVEGVIRDFAHSDIVFMEKVQQHAELGHVLVKNIITQTTPHTSVKSMIYIDPKVTTVDEVKQKMLDAVIRDRKQRVESREQSLADARKDIDKFHRHYVATVAQIKPMADLFKAAKAL